MPEQNSRFSAKMERIQPGLTTPGGGGAPRSAALAALSRETSQES